MVFAGEAQKTRYVDQKPTYFTKKPKSTKKTLKNMKNTGLLGASL